MYYMLLSATIICSLILSGCVAKPVGRALLRGTQPLLKIGLAAPFEGLDRPMGYEALTGVKLPWPNEMRLEVSVVIRSNWSL
jgi:hypothetical protein